MDRKLLCFLLVLGVIVAIAVGCGSKGPGAQRLETPTGGDPATQIVNACKFGDVGLAKEALSSDPDLINHRSPHGDTPLHVAARFGNPKLVRLLIDRGADVNAEDFDGNTPMDAAIDTGASKEVEEILKAAGGE